MSYLISFIQIDEPIDEESIYCYEVTISDMLKQTLATQGIHTYDRLRQYLHTYRNNWDKQMQGYMTMMNTTMQSILLIIL